MMNRCANADVSAPARAVVRRRVAFVIGIAALAAGAPVALFASPQRATPSRTAAQRTTAPRKAAPAPPTPLAAKPSATPAPAKANTPLSERERIVHVLNRLGFGPRPGDIERVQAMGLDRYIDAQLHPERIDDSRVDSRLAAFTSLNLSGMEVAQMESDVRRGIASTQRLLAQRQQNDPSMAPGMAPGTAPGMAPGNRTENPNPQAGNPAAQNPQAQNPAARRALYQSLPPEQRQMLDDARVARERVDGAAYQMVQNKIVRAAESERQLQEVLVDFWANHFNIDVAKTRAAKLPDEREVIRAHAFGKFRDLLFASAKSPAMLIYLDNYQSVGENAPQNAPGFGPMGRPGFGQPGAPRPGFGQPGAGQPGGMPQITLEQLRQAAAQGRPQAVATLQRLEDAAKQNGVTVEEAYTRFQNQARQGAQKRGINENYARELMELHTLGVDGGYTQKDVTEVARCLTGWGVDGVNGGGNRYGGEFAFHARAHDNGEKLVLGHTIPAGGGIRDGETVLALLADHPSTMRFVSTKLCRRFVSDDPPASLVDKCVATWKRTDGDIREIVKTIVTSPEFYARSAYRQKIKSPFEYAVSAVRAMGGTVETPIFRRVNLFQPNANNAGDRSLIGQVATLGQPLYQFSFPTGYPEDSRKWVSSGALIARLNYALGLVNGRISDVDLSSAVTLTDAGKPSGALIDLLAAQLLGGDLTPSTRATLLAQVSQTPNNADAAQLDQTRRLAALLLGSPEFQRR